MAQERLTMRKIKEILRLKYEAKLSNRAIAGAFNVSNSTVGEYLRRAGLAGIQWPLGEEKRRGIIQKALSGKESGRIRASHNHAELGRCTQRKTKKRGVTATVMAGV